MHRPIHVIVPHQPESERPGRAGSRPGTSNISFGRVNVHRHRMTLGNNPFASSGIPVELAWDVESSDEMSIEDYESTSENTPERSKPRRLPPHERREIAEEHHSRESIFAVLKEASLIRHAVVKSLEDEDDETADADASLYVDPKSRSPSPPPAPEHECLEEAPGKIPWSKRLCERMQSERIMQKECQTETPPDISLSKRLSHKNFKLSKRVCDRLQHGRSSGRTFTKR